MSKRMRWAEHVESFKKEGFFKNTFVEKHERGWLLGRPRSRRENISNKGIAVTDVKWIHMAQQRDLVKTVMNLHQLILKTSFPTWSSLTI
jgi:hypothetical protein